MYCTSCGSRNADESNFCKQCGHRLEKPVSVKISEEDFEKALPDDERAVALVERAYRLRKHGKTEEAVAACEEAIRLREDSTTAHSLLGQLYEGLGDHEGAIREFERVLNLNPGSIADRVMLDDLRAGRTQSDANPSVKPRILLVDRNEGGISTQAILTTAGIAAIALLIGIGGALLWNRGKPSDNAQNNSSSAQHSSLPSNNGANSGTANSGTIPAGLNSNLSGNPYPSVPQGGYPVYPPYYQQPYTNPPAENRVVYVQAPASTRTQQNGVQAQQSTGGRRNTASSGDDSENVRLPPDDAAEKPIVINVPEKQGRPANSGDQDSSNHFEHIKVNYPTDSASQGASDGPGSDALKWIAIASDKNQQKDYSGAVKALRNAIPAAGNKLAYVYLEMARGYEHLQDKNNALSCYTTSLNEWEKLLNANQQVETARASIKVCQNGIKLCTAE